MIHPSLRDRTPTASSPRSGGLRPVDGTAGARPDIGGAAQAVTSFRVMFDAVEEFHPVRRQTMRAGTLPQQCDVAG